MLYVVTVNREKHEKQEMMRAERDNEANKCCTRKHGGGGFLRSMERKQLHTTWNIMNGLGRKHGNMIAESEDGCMRG